VNQSTIIRNSLYKYKRINVLKDKHNEGKNIIQNEVVSGSSQAVTVVTVSVKDERGGQDHTSESLLCQSAT
jgi:hypothetical protein